MPTAVTMEAGTRCTFAPFPEPIEAAPHSIRLTGLQRPSVVGRQRRHGVQDGQLEGPFRRAQCVFRAGRRGLDVVRPCGPRRNLALLNDKAPWRGVGCRPAHLRTCSLRAAPVARTAACLAASARLTKTESRSRERASVTAWTASAAASFTVSRSRYAVLPASSKM